MKVRKDGILEVQPVSDNGGSLTVDGTVESTQYALQLDDTGSGVVYIGEAVAGSVTSAAVWRVKRLTETGADLVIEWADGNTSFDNVWDDRLSLSYS